MEQKSTENSSEVKPEVVMYDMKSQFMRPTRFSKYLSFALFIILPLIGILIGYNYGYVSGIDAQLHKVYGLERLDVSSHTKTQECPDVCPMYVPPAPDFCADGVIEPQEPWCGCNMPPKCVQAESNEGTLFVSHPELGYVIEAKCMDKTCIPEQREASGPYISTIDLTPDLAFNDKIEVYVFSRESLDKWSAAIAEAMQQGEETGDAFPYQYAPETLVIALSDATEPGVIEVKRIEGDVVEAIRGEIAGQPAVRLPNIIRSKTTYVVALNNDRFLQFVIPYNEDELLENILNINVY